MTIGERIKELRKENNMTQKNLAGLLFLSQDTISLWETNKSLPDLESVIKLTQIFKVSSDFLLGIEN